VWLVPGELRALLKQSRRCRVPDRFTSDSGKRRRLASRLAASHPVNGLVRAAVRTPQGTSDLRGIEWIRGVLWPERPLLTCRTGYPPRRILTKKARCMDPSTSFVRFASHRLWPLLEQLSKRMGVSSEISRAPCFGCGGLSGRSLSNGHTVIQSM
jgi:hypothetical protein